MLQMRLLLLSGCVLALVALLGVVQRTDGAAAASAAAVTTTKKPPVLKVSVTTKTKAKASADDGEVVDETSDYLDEGELSAALTNSKPPPHHHHVHVHPKGSKPATSRKPACNCTAPPAAGASRVSPPDPLQVITTTTTTTTAAPASGDDDDDDGGSRAALADQDDMDDYLDDEEPVSTTTTSKPAGGKSRLAAGELVHSSHAPNETPAPVKPVASTSKPANQDQADGDDGAD